MIGRIAGIILHRAQDHVLIDVRGVGYIVHVSERTAAALPPAGQATALYTELLVREDLLQLFGFPTLLEKEWHRLLTSVQGVGAKVGLAILGTLGPEGLARALALDPPLMIYDEPLTGLDPIASGVIMSLIKRLNDSLGLTSIIVSHHVHETLPICDQALVIANEGIVFSGTPEQLQASTDPLVRQFLHGQPDGPIPFDAAPRARVA